MTKGRSMTQHGYVLIRVGKEHHLADVRGYAYEHRLIAEASLGRRLLEGEVVHHMNGNPSDNRPENLEVLPSIVEHRLEHRSPESNLQKPNEPNDLIACACGCGSSFARFDRLRRPRRFVSGHNLHRRKS